MEPVRFSSKTGIKELSNFYPAPIDIEGVQWPTVEHFFQAQKFPGDPVLQEKIRGAATPASAKRLGRTRSPHFRSDWEQVKESVMLQGLRAKFSEGALRATLKATGTAELVEAAAWDSYWGTGRNGKGLNRMGAALAQVRSEI